ncbi:MAG: HIT family protein [Fibrobacter sp.]|jgi:histidine triad (HIT) family protein|nr:HIT family protein [Fibrobacter sp.]
MNDCTFCQIIKEQISAFTVFENSDSIAFLDKRPLFPGHVLLIPKTHISILAEMPDEKIGPFFRTVRNLSVAVEKAMNAQGSFVAINNRVSQSVPHLHVHIVPRNRGDGLRGFFWPRKKYKDKAEMIEVADRIKKAINSNEA